jgi:hypothetical protein
METKVRETKKSKCLRLKVTETERGKKKGKNNDETEVKKTEEQK